MCVPIAIEYAVMIREKDEFVTRGQRFGDGDIPRPGGSAVCLQGHVFNVAISQ
jgi:hypothetical protein